MMDSPMSPHLLLQTCPRAGCSVSRLTQLLPVEKTSSSSKKLTLILSHSQTGN